MSEPFVAEIKIFAGNFAPVGYALCNGQLMPISQNTALFSLLGTTYGGDGRSTFGLPNLQGRAPIHPGQGPGLSLYDLGEVGGEETVTLLPSELPAHSHSLMGSGNPGANTDPQGNTIAQSVAGLPQFAPTPNVAMSANALTPHQGGNLPHNNMQPYLTTTFIIALTGIFPPRS